MIIRRQQRMAELMILVLTNMLLPSTMIQTNAFSTSGPSPVLKQKQHQKQPLLSPLTTLRMSDIPREDNGKNDRKRSTTKKLKKWIEKQIPPPPEDQLVMSGDIIALFVYSFLDHMFCETYADTVLSVDTTSASSIETVRHLDPLGEWSGHTIPVWFDSHHYLTADFTPEKLLLMMGLPNVLYSPVISTGGTAAVILTSCWLLSGYINKAFLYKNTLNCSLARNLKVTAKTWLVSTALVVTLALGSDYAVGHFLQDPVTLQSQSIGGLTRADTDYIFDSLTVVLLWRAVLSLMIGGGSDDDCSNTTSN